MEQLAELDKPQITLVNRKNSNNQLKFQLRDYQKQVIGQIYEWYRWGKKSVMLVSPTGSGKTLTATHIISDAVSRNCRVLFIVHREPLIDQTVNTLINYGIRDRQIGYIKAGYPHAEGDEMVIVASVQTLARRDYPKDIGLVIFDESHTTSFYSSAQDLIDHYATAPVVALSKVKFLHLTATPFRTKAKEYFPHVEVAVQAPDIKSLIKMGYLVPARHFGYGGLLDLTKLDTGKDGDYKQSQINVVCAEEEYNTEVVRRFKEICSHRKAIAFCAGVEQSQLLTELFNIAGIVTAHIQAETPTEQRKAIFTEFKNGEIQIISSVGTLTEGFDEPSVEAVIIARPTKSLALLIQMCGRGLRLSPDKEDCLLLDFGENFKRLGRIDKKRKISLCPSPPRPNTDTKECPDCHALINIFLRICPECGYVFPPGEQSELFDNFLPEFGELLDEETKQKITYIRSQRKARFTKKLLPDDLWALWSKRYNDTILCNDWLYQAVFRGDTSVAAQQQFLSYLYSFNPQSPKWVSFHMELEFGNPNRLYKSKSIGRYSPPPVSHERLNWWELLQVSSSATLDEVKGAYSKLASKLEEDEIKLLNWAYNEFENLTLPQSNKEYALCEIIDWNDIIAEIDLHLARLGWSIDRARAYLMRTYGVKSRLYLTDPQIMSFLDYLKAQ
ncbi:MAG: DEAD/DEAH box helicase family protein [Xenococcaceae cyanobacterium]